MEMSLKKSVDKFVLDRKEYYKQWMFEEPIIIGKDHNDKLIKLQKIMYKLIFEFVTCYSKYKDMMPVDSKTEEIIKIFNQKEYKIGTYRTDFVYDENNQVKLIEITCRFALNGMFLSQLINSVAIDYYNKNNYSIKIEDLYEPIYHHFESYLKDVKSIFILKGNDVTNESKIYKEIFTRAGYNVHEVNYKEVDKNIDLMKDAWVISELSFDEITSLSISTINNLMPLNIINDFRTIFLIHDKRFFSVLGKQKLLENVLTSEEIQFFKEFYIPTYTSIEETNIWNTAKLEKDKWIIKHRALGKSQKIFAGIVTKKEEWESLFSKTNKTDMILQKWIPQKTISGKIGNEIFEDYVTGTLLYFDNHYFGLGPFRSSSHPVTNVLNDRKVTSLVLKNKIERELGDFLNYIKC